MKTKILISAFAITFLSFLNMNAQEHDHSKMKKGTTEMNMDHSKMEMNTMYTCQMHPDVKSDKAGKCPKCGMELKKTEKTVYSCPMKCEGEKTYDKEGSCPKCKMDLKKVSDSKNTSCCAGKKMDSAKMECKPDKMAKMYACPMKCEGEKTYDKSGSCPKCNMDLKKMEIKKEK